MNLILTEDLPGVPFAKSGDLLTTLDMTTGATRFSPPPRGRPPTYDESMAAARQAFAAGDPWTAHDRVLQAEQGRSLTPEDQQLAARIASLLAAEESDIDAESVDAKDAWLDAARRWREVTELSAVNPTAFQWSMRAEAELQLAELPAARDSAHQALLLNRNDARALLTMARVSDRQGHTRESVLRLLGLALDAAWGPDDSDSEDSEPADPDTYDQVVEFQEELARRDALAEAEQARAQRRQRPVRFKFVDDLGVLEPDDPDAAPAD